MSDDIRDLISAAVARRNEARDAWAERLVAQLEELPGHCLTVGEHKLRRRTVWATCSQGQGWPGTSRSEAAWVIDDRWTFGDLDLSFHDGSNHQHQRGPVMLGGWDDDSATKLRPAPVEILAEIARDLPAALEAVLNTLREEAEMAEAEMRRGQS